MERNLNEGGYLNEEMEMKQYKDHYCQHSAFYMAISYHIICIFEISD